MLDDISYLPNTPPILRLILTITDLLENAGCQVEPNTLKKVINRINQKAVEQNLESIDDAIYLSYQDLLNEMNLEPEGELSEEEPLQGEELDDQTKLDMYEEANKLSLNELLDIYTSIGKRGETKELSERDEYAYENILPDLIRKKQEPIQLSMTDEELRTKIEELFDDIVASEDDPFADIPNKKNKLKLMRNIAERRNIRLPIYIKQYPLDE